MSEVSNKLPTLLRMLVQMGSEYSMFKIWHSVKVAADCSGFSWKCSFSLAALGMQCSFGQTHVQFEWDLCSASEYPFLEITLQRGLGTRRYRCCTAFSVGRS